MCITDHVKLIQCVSTKLSISILCTNYFLPVVTVIFTDD